MNMDGFVKLYMHFEEEILSTYPDVEILIENRCGSQHSGGFIISTTGDLYRLVKLIEKYELRLRIALDIPQLFTAHGLNI